MPSSRGPSRLRDQTRVSCFAGRVFTIWANKESLGMWIYIKLLSSAVIFTLSAFYLAYLPQLFFPVFWHFVAQLVKNLPAMRKTWVQSLGWEDPLEKGKATHSMILAWKIPWTIQSMGLQRIGQNWATFTSPAFWRDHWENHWLLQFIQTRM